MTSLPLILYPSPILCKKSDAIEHYTPEKFSAIIYDMAETMKLHQGIGLAAPQIGKNMRLVIVLTKDGVLPLINPEIKKFSIHKTVSEEGCLSIPGVFGLVRRPYAVTVSAIFEDGTRSEFRAEGLFARVIQHEIDHINGILFIDKTKKITKGKELLKPSQK